MLPGSNYELFTPSQTATGDWEAFVHPEYYGLLMFAQAFPLGAQLLAAGAPSGPVKVWATRDSAGVIRVTLINKDPSAEHDVALQVTGGGAPAALETLTAPSINSTGGITIGGQSFGDDTTTGALGPMQTSPVVPAGETYSVPLPAASAALLTIG
jgi:Glycosyl hydrolase family 79 C-terminal beta domain